MEFAHVVVDPDLRRFVHILEAIGAASDPESVADILWLASHIVGEPNAIADSRPDTAGEEATQIALPDMVPPPPSAATPAGNLLSPTSPMTASAVPPNLGRAVPAFSEASLLAGSEGIPSIPFTSPGAQALPNKLGIARALRPFNRKALSRVRREMDVDATIEAIVVGRLGHQRAWWPVQRPILERRYDVVLFADEWPSMVIWEDTIREFKLLLEQQGAFRNVDLWGLSSSSDGKKLEWRAGYGKSAISLTPQSPDSLIQIARPRLLLFLSDFLSPSWASGAIDQAMQTWQRHCTIAAVQMLAMGHWHKTHLEEMWRASLRALRAGEPNADYELRIKKDGDVLSGKRLSDDVVHGVPFPVVALEARSIADWASALVGGNGKWHRGFLWNPQSLTSDNSDDQIQEPDHVENADEILRSFLVGATPEARRLAASWAALPLTLPIMRVAHSATLGASAKQSQFAEVFLSGLLERSDSAKNAQGLQTDQVRYDFRQGVRELLAIRAKPDDIRDVLNSVSRFIAGEANPNYGFTAYIKGQLNADPARLSPDSREFARVAPDVLRRMGFSHEADLLAATEKPYSIQEPVPAQEELRNAYLRYVIAKANHMPLFSMGDAGFLSDLSSIYTATLTQVEAGKSATRSSSAFSALNTNPKLVVLGGPGSGKSTFANHVILCMAGELLGRTDANLNVLTATVPADLGDLGSGLGKQTWDHGPLIPVLVPLRDFFAEHSSSGANADGIELWEHIAKQLDQAGLADYAPFFRTEMKDRGGLIVLDGLDEVPGDTLRLEDVNRIVQHFIEEFPKCRFLVTSRTHAYARQVQKLTGFAEVTLASFTGRQAERFIDTYFVQLVRHRRLTTADAESRAELLKRVVRTNVRVRELAENPLLLTLMVFLQIEAGGVLPEKKADLYARAVELLLTQWESLKTNHQPKGTREVESGMTELLKAGRDEIRRALDELAFEAHRDQRSLAGAADILQERLVKALLDVSPRTDFNPRLVESYLRDRAGILVASSATTYQFLHRGFQEYLAACHLARYGFPDEMSRLAIIDPDRWRDVVLLAAAEVARGTPESIWSLIDALCPADYTTTVDLARSETARWGIFLAGQVLFETGLAEPHLGLAARNETIRQRVQSLMYTIIEPGLLTTPNRDLALRALGAMTKATVVNYAYLQNLQRVWTRPRPPALLRDAIGRDEPMQALRDELDKRGGAAVIGMASTIAVHGWSGVGKTVLAQLMAKEFDEGGTAVIWENLGSDFLHPDQAQAVLRRWAGYATNFFGLPENLNKLFTFDPSAVRALLSEHTPLLVVLDDVWSSAAIVPLRDAIPPGVQLIITTRERKLARELGAAMVEVGSLTDDEALDLFSVRLMWRPTRSASAWAFNLIDALEGHALGLDVALGVLGRYGKATNGRAPAIWAKKAANLIAAARSGDAGRLHLGDSDSGHTLQAMLTFSYAALTTESRRRFRCLGAFAPDAGFSTNLAAATWSCDPEAAFKTLTDFASAALLDHHGDGEWKQHPLLRSYAVMLLREEGEAGKPNREHAARAHARYYAGAMRDAYEEQRAHQMLADLPQIRHAFEWALEKDLELALDIVEPCGDLQTQFGYARESASWSDRILAAAQAGSAPATLARAWWHWANRLRDIAALSGGERPSRLMAALGAYDRALEFYSRDTNPLSYAAIQNNRANLLRDIATLPGENRRDRLLTALDSFDRALHQYRPEPGSLSYAATQNNRATLLRDIAALPGEDRRSRLMSALEAYDRVLEHSRPDTAPLSYATAQSNRATLLSEIAILPGEDRRARLLSALKAYDRALEFRHPDTAPLDYALTLNNQATVLSAIATLPGEDRRARLYSALEAIDRALEIRRPDTAPLDYAMTQNNRANRLTEISALPGEDRQKGLLAALEAYDRALDYLRPGNAPLEYAATQSNRANVLTEISTLPGEDLRGRLMAALDAYDTALEFQRPDTIPLAYAATQNNRAILLTKIATLPGEDRGARLVLALEACSRALEQLHPDTTPLDYASTKKNRETLLKEIAALADQERRFRLSRAQRTKWSDKMSQAFDLAEIEGICFDLGINAEDIPGSTRASKIRELIQYCDRHGRLNELLTRIKVTRPHIAWPAVQASDAGSIYIGSAHAEGGGSASVINTIGSPTYTGPIDVEGDFRVSDKLIQNYPPVSPIGVPPSGTRSGRIRILLCTATDMEDDTLLDVIERNGYAKEPITLNKGTYRGLGQIGTADVVWVRSGMGGSGSSSALATTLDAVDELKPDYVIACGLAFGANPTEQKLGDVLVSEWVRAYEKGKAKPGGFIPRGAKTMADNLLLQAARSARWDARDFKVIIGGLLSGEKLVDDPTFKAELWKREPEAVGGELEASGIIEAASRRTVRWLIVKAICDWGNHSDREAQSIAAQNAIRFVFSMIAGGLIRQP